MVKMMNEENGAFEAINRSIRYRNLRLRRKSTRQQIARCNRKKWFGTLFQAKEFVQYHINIYKQVLRPYKCSVGGITHYHLTSQNGVSRL